MRSVARAQPLAAPPPGGLLGFPPPPCGDLLRARLDLEPDSPEALASLGCLDPRAARLALHSPIALGPTQCCG